MDGCLDSVFIVVKGVADDGLIRQKLVNKGSMQRNKICAHNISTVRIKVGKKELVHRFRGIIVDRLNKFVSYTHRPTNVEQLNCPKMEVRFALHKDSILSLYCC